MEILLTRHGQTEWNLLKKVQGKADRELNEKGIQQAEETRDFLKNEKIDFFPYFRTFLLTLYFQTL